MVCLLSGLRLPPEKWKLGEVLPLVPLFRRTPESSKLERETVANHCASFLAERVRAGPCGQAAGSRTLPALFDGRPLSCSGQGRERFGVSHQELVEEWSKAIGRPYSSQPKTSSRPTPNTREIRNALSSEGEYFPCSIAMIVCRETPIALASADWLIGPWASRNSRTRFVIGGRVAIIPPADRRRW